MVRAMLARGFFYWLRVPKSREDLVQDEWILAIARLALSACCVFTAFGLDLSRFPQSARSFALSYHLFSVFLVLVIHFFPNLRPGIRILIHCTDLLWAAHLTLLIFWPTTSYLLFFFISLSTVLRWGFWEAQLTNLLFGLVLIAGCQSYHLTLWQVRNYQRPADLLPDVIVYLAMSVMLGVIAEGKAYRSKSYSMIRVLQKLRLEAGLEEALRSLSTEGAQMYGANQVITAVYENGSSRFLLFRVGSANPVLESVDSSRLPDYFFPAPAETWRLESTGQSGQPRFRCTTLQDCVLKRKKSQCGVPDSFMQAHPFRVLLASALKLDQDWDARVYILDPAPLFGGHAGLHFLGRVAGQLTPTIRDLFLVGRLRNRTKAAVQGRVARELHDGIIQSLSGINLQIDQIRREAGTLFSGSGDPLSRIQRSIQDEITSLRDFTQQLRMLEVDSTHFLDFVTGLTVKFQCEHGITARFISDVGQVKLSTAVCTELARIVQEGLVNARKHSGATEVLVRLFNRNGNRVLSIMDNGRGFGFTGRREQEELQASGEGPIVIIERARTIDGKVAVESVEGKGSVVEVVFNR